MIKQKKRFNIWTLILIASIGYFCYMMYSQQIYLDQRQEQYNKLKSEIHSETLKNQQLLNQKAKISSDEFAEKIAREKLGYVKDGEKIYVDTNK